MRIHPVGHASGESEINRATFEGLYQRRARAPSVGINRVWTKDDAKLDQSMTVQEFLEFYAGAIGQDRACPGSRGTSHPSPWVSTRVHGPGDPATPVSDSGPAGAPCV